MSKYFKDVDELKRILRNLDYNLNDDELENIGIMLMKNINIYDFKHYPLMENNIELFFDVILGLYGADFMQKRILKCSQTSYYNLYNYFKTGVNKPTSIFKQLYAFYKIITIYLIDDRYE